MQDFYNHYVAFTLGVMVGTLTMALISSYFQQQGNKLRAYQFDVCKVVGYVVGSTLLLNILSLDLIVQKIQVNKDPESYLVIIASVSSIYSVRNLYNALKELLELLSNPPSKLAGQKKV